MAMLLKGAAAAGAITAHLQEEVAALKENGVTPCLAILRVGEREDDLSYERGAVKRCTSIGVAVKNVVLPMDCTQGTLLEAIESINSDRARPRLPHVPAPSQAPV